MDGLQSRPAVPVGCAGTPHGQRGDDALGSELYIQSATIDGVVISGFEWDDGNVPHIARHGFTPDEVEEVFAGDHKVRRAGQKRYIALGETLDGRLALVVFRSLPGGLIRVITARDMDDGERRLFRRK